MSDLEIRKVVYGLEQAGLVEIVKPAGAEQKKAAASSRAAGGGGRGVRRNHLCKKMW